MLHSSRHALVNPVCFSEQEGATTPNLLGNKGRRYKNHKGSLFQSIVDKLWKDTSLCHDLTPEKSDNEDRDGAQIPRRSDQNLALHACVYSLSPQETHSEVSENHCQQHQNNNKNTNKDHLLSIAPKSASFPRGAKVET